MLRVSSQYLARLYFPRHPKLHTPCLDQEKKNRLDPTLVTIQPTHKACAPALERSPYPHRTPLQTLHPKRSKKIHGIQYGTPGDRSWRFSTAAIDHPRGWRCRSRAGRGRRRGGWDSRRRWCCRARLSRDGDAGSRAWIGWSCCDRRGPPGAADRSPTSAP